MTKKNLFTENNLAQFVSDFDIEFEWIVCVENAEESLSVTKKIADTLRAYKVLAAADLLYVASDDALVITEKILAWGTENDLEINSADQLFLESLLSAKTLKISAFVVSNLLGIYVPGKKILTIPRKISNPVFLEKISVFDFVFSSEKKDHACWKYFSSASIKFLVGLTSKLPKKLAKKACELIVGSGVVMERGI